MKPLEIEKIRKHLMRWYDENQRDLPWRHTRDPYHIWVSEVMLQQTQVNTVIPYYERFIKKYPRIEDLAKARQQAVLKKWEGLGYYARARNFHKAAKIVAEDYKGIVPREYEPFKKLPGVGDYIAAAVLSIAFGYPAAVVDGNVKRVLARLFSLENPVNKPSNHKIFHKKVSRLLDKRKPGIFNQAIMELGALVCTPMKPDCTNCVLRHYCRACQLDKVADYPKRVKKKTVPQHHMVAGVVEKNGLLLICRRKQEGLLGGLWEFPGGMMEKGESAEKACRRKIKEAVNLVVNPDTFITQVRHAFTHFKVILDVFGCQYVSGRVRLNGPVDFKWIRLSQIDQYPLPAAHSKLVEILKNIRKP